MALPTEQNGDSVWTVQTSRRIIYFPADLPQTEHINTPEEAIAFCVKTGPLYEWEAEGAVALCTLSNGHKESRVNGKT